jgi:Tfp pilus assembly protein PilX
VKRLRSVRKEQGVALPIAMAIMTILAVALVAVIGFTSAGARHSDSSQAENDAFAVAEAGINVALSLLGTASNPTVSTLLPTTTTNVEGGTVTYSGTYAGPVWTITATGRVANPSGSDGEVVRTLQQKVTVQPLVPGATPPEIRIENTDGSWPDFFAWPELQSLVAGQMYGSFATAASYKLILGEQVG